MTTQKFEVFGSLKLGINGTEAFLASNTTEKVTYSELVEAVCLLRHKRGLKEDKAIGYKITQDEVAIYFER